MINGDLKQKFLDHGCLPHQAEFAAAFFLPDSSRKHLLSSVPGSGKTFAVGEIVNYGLASGQLQRILVIAPSLLLVDQWTHLIQKGNPSVPVRRVDRRVIREFEATKKYGEEIWPACIVAIVTSQFARQKDIAEIILDTKWDLLIIDEIHRISDNTQEGELIQDLLSNSPESRAILLSVKVSDTISEPIRRIDLRESLAVTEWAREDVRDAEGHQILPDAKIEWLEYERRIDEKELLVRLQDSLRPLRSPSLRMSAVDLFQSAASSLFALEQNLRRIRQRRNELTHGSSRTDRYLDGGNLVEPLNSQITDELVLAKQTSWLLDQLEKVTTDSKLDALLRFIGTVDVNDGSKLSACIVTKYSSTATYLKSAINDHGSLAKAITGSLSFEERDQVMKEFSEDGGVLIVTDAVMGTIPKVGQVIFYDIPLNTAAIAEWIGMFVRVSRRHPVQFLALRDRSNTLAIEVLQEKLAEHMHAIKQEEIDEVLFSERS